MGITVHLGVLAEEKLRLRDIKEEEQGQACVNLEVAGYWYIRQSINGVWTDNSLSEWERGFCAVWTQPCEP